MTARTYWDLRRDIVTGDYGDPLRFIAAPLLHAAAVRGEQIQVLKDRLGRVPRLQQNALERQAATDIARNIVADQSITLDTFEAAVVAAEQAAL